MSNKDHIWFDKHGEIDIKGRVHNGNLTVAEAIAKLDPKRIITPY